MCGSIGQQPSPWSLVLTPTPRSLGEPPHSQRGTASSPKDGDRVNPLRACVHSDQFGNFALAPFYVFSPTAGPNSSPLPPHRIQPQRPIVTPSQRCRTYSATMERTTAPLYRTCIRIKTRLIRAELWQSRCSYTHFAIKVKFWNKTASG